MGAESRTESETSVNSIDRQLAVRFILLICRPQDLGISHATYENSTQILTVSSFTETAKRKNVKYQSF